MGLERWKKAQESEKNYWLSTKSIDSGESRKQYFKEKISHGFDIDYDFFAGKSVLEIGCGPNGIIFQIDNAKTRVGLEPLDLNQLTHDEWKKSIIRNGVGEEIPYENDSFDVIISFNSLDHCISPVKVVEEAHRVLREDGDMLIWLHVLRQKYYFLGALLNKIDSSHPYHITNDKLLKILVDGGFQVKQRKYDNGMGLPNNSIKKMIGNCIMADSWLWLRKNHQ